MADNRNTAALAFAPVLSQQKSAAPFGKSVDLNLPPTIVRPLDQALIAETKKIGVELAATTERQANSNLPWIMPASIVKRLEHQALQFAALSHKTILPAFVSTLFFVTGTAQENEASERNGKNLHFAKDFSSKFTFQLFPLFLREKVCK